MIISWQDRDWEWRPDEITVEMARQIRDFTGRGLRSWSAGINDGEPDSLIALWWAVQHQNGVARNINDLEDLATPRFLAAVDLAAHNELQRRLEEAGRREEPKFRPKAGSPTRKRTPMSGGNGTATSSS